MYQEHFGLKTKPFGSNAEGPAVFVGPQQTNVINSLKKGLNAVDAIVAVSGPVGVGKTTIVARALESLSPGRMVALVGRMKLAPDEVLELLLTGFGISRQATGTIQRFAAFRRLLTERAAAGAQVAIVVEDAQRVGLDALVELESLTAADSGDATGANIILMGHLDLNEWLATPALARLRQRTRLRQVVEPFTAAEVLGYLRHSIRAAGGDFDSMFDGGAVDMLYRCSEGIPRVINNLCESALSMAADEGTNTLTAIFIQKVARDALGIEVLLPHTPAPPIPPAIATEPEPIAESKPAPAPAPAPAPEIPQPDIESTLTQKKPEWTGDELNNAGNNNEVQAEKEGKKSGEDAEPMFKAAPMITVDRNTQVGVLPKSPAQPETKPQVAKGPADEDLPMLSQSMRIEAPTPAPLEALLAEARPKPKPLTSTETGTEAEAGGRSEASTKTCAETGGGSKTSTDGARGSEAEAESAGGSETNVETCAEADGGSKTSTNGARGSEAEAEGAGGSETRAEAKTETRTKARGEAKSKSETR